MGLDRGFQDIITACKSDPPSLVALIAKVRAYMCLYLAFTQQYQDFRSG
jgi:hypothetical protein